MSEEDEKDKVKFFDVAGVAGSTDDLKKLRDLFGKVIAPRVEQLKVYRMDGRIRLRVKPDELSTMNWDKLPKRIKGIKLEEVHEDGTVQPLGPSIVDPAAVSVHVTVETVVVSRMVQHRRLFAVRRRPASARRRPTPVYRLV